MTYSAACHCLEQAIVCITVTGQLCSLHPFMCHYASCNSASNVARQQHTARYEILQEIEVEDVILYIVI